MMFPTSPLFTEKDGVLHLNQPTLFTCNCGSVVARWASILNFLPPTSIPRMQASVPAAKQWLRENGVLDAQPQMRNRAYGVFVLPDGRSQDITQGAAPFVAEKIKTLLDSFSSNNS